jgi:hypothetical protein
MGHAARVILKVEAPKLGVVVVETSDGYRHHSNLSSLSAVYCYPKDDTEWSKVSIDSYGRGLQWTCRFEVHLDQVVALATRSERLEKSA